VPLMLTLVWNRDLDQLLASIPRDRFEAYLEGKGWLRRTENKVEGINMWEYKNPDLKEVPLVPRVLSLPAPHCYEKAYTDLGRRAWELVTDLAVIESRSPLAVLCEIYPKLVDILDSGLCPSRVSPNSTAI